MKKLRCLVCVLAVLLAFARPDPAWAETDYAGSVALDFASGTAKQTVTVKTFVDGDTAHFAVPASVDPSGVLKGRFLACNTPESTGKIEEWGKAASRFTREKLENAEEIVIESDGGKWEKDSTGSRFLVWVWYRPPGERDFRNLNIELLQEGLAIANSSAQNRYGDTCMAAIAQARELKKHVYSGEKDPDFCYGDAIELTIRELRLHPEAYEGKKVAFSGVVIMDHNNAVFIEDYDEETDLYFGISAYYGFNMSGAGLDVLTVGNEVRIVGTVQYYEAGQAWQVSGLTYRMMKPDDPGNIQKLGTGREPVWRETDPETFREPVTVETERGPETYPLAFLAMDTSVSVTARAELVKADPDGLFCLDCGGLKVYAPPLRDETGRLLSAEDFAVTGEDARGITASRLVLVRGVADRINGEYCIRVYTPSGITFLD